LPCCFKSRAGYYGTVLALAGVLFLNFAEIKCQITLFY